MISMVLKIACSVGVVVVSFGGARLAAGDWPQWGGDESRCMVSTETDLPDSFTPRRASDPPAASDSAPDNVKWTARLGSSCYGNPTVANGKVFVGTNTVTFRDDPRYQRYHMGMVKCFDEKTGKLLWQLVVPERTHGLPDEKHYGLQHLGVCSSPTVDGDRVYIMSCADEILCLDVNGLANGNDGPFTDEGQYIAGHGHAPVKLAAQDADIIWRFDLIDELGVCPHDATSCSVVIHGDVLYTGTSNGVGGPKGSNWIQMHSFVVHPKAPALVALDKNTGRFLARENIGLSERLFHCQWSSPSVGRVGDRTLLFFGGGDGVCYAFETLKQVPSKPVDLKLVWSYDCNPPEYRLKDGKPIPYYDGDKRHKDSPNKNDGKYLGPSQLIATPAFYNNRVYVAIGQDPAHGRGRGLLHCIDATLEGDITKTGCVWKFDGIQRSISTAAVADGLVYIPDIAGNLYCLDADTGERQWKQDTQAETWGGVLVADGKLYLVNTRHFFVFDAGRQLKLRNTIRLKSPAYSTPIAANGVLYVATRSDLWAVANN